MSYQKVKMLSISSFFIGTFTLSAGDYSVDDSVISQQRQTLKENTYAKGFGPQSPRDIDNLSGVNYRLFEEAPDYSAMNLCNIHFHKNAEHKGGDFTKYAGDDKGFKYAKLLTKSELKPLNAKVCESKHDGLSVGDTIEVHYVHSTAKVKPAPTLGACLSDALKNPQLRVEAQIMVLVNDSNALDFGELTEHKKINGYHQAINIPTNMGVPIQYEGSTTGPSYNEKGSPFQVSWSVRPKVAKVYIKTVQEWCMSNVFDEDHGHGVRNLVVNPELLSEIK